MDFDAGRASLREPDSFQRFRVTGDGIPLAEAGLGPKDKLLVFERNGQRRALLQHQMAYHHAAQGDLAGEPYLVSF
ncbi:MAG: hypothetical protein QGF00_28220 [Planctomycetota bacterium]|nr:hypothetical protein [Planctomycetota bacterium]